MKFITNLFIVISLIIYIFCPFIDLGLLGSLTGYGFTEKAINDSEDIFTIILSLVPFFAGFTAIYTNCLKQKVWASISLLCMIIYLSYYYYIYNYLDLTKVLNITGFGTGYKLSMWFALISILLIIISLFQYFMSSKNKILEKNI